MGLWLLAPARSLAYAQTPHQRCARPLWMPSSKRVGFELTRNSMIKESRILDPTNSLPGNWHPASGNLFGSNPFNYCFGSRQMKLVIAFFLVFSQLLGTNVYASQRADSGKVYCVLRQIQKPHATAQGLVINKIGFCHHFSNLVRVEDENEENLYKKLSSTGSLLVLCTVTSFHYHPSFSNSLFFCRPISGAGSCRYIANRVLRI